MKMPENLTLAQARAVAKLRERHGVLVTAIEGGILSDEIRNWRALRASPTPLMIAAVAEKLSSILGEPVSGEQAEVLIKWAIAREAIGEMFP